MSREYQRAVQSNNSVVLPEPENCKSAVDDENSAFTKVTALTHLEAVLEYAIQFFNRKYHQTDS